MKRKRTFKNLKTWRKAHKLAQREAAEKLGLSQPVYCRLELQQRAPKPRVAKAISAATGVPLESVLGLSL